MTEQSAWLDLREGTMDTAGKTNPVVVFNALSHPRTELVTVDAPDETTAVIDPSGIVGPVQRTSDGRAIFEVTVPPCGYRVYDLVTGASGSAAGEAVGSR